MHELLQKIIDTIPFYQEILHLDIAFSVSDMEKYIYLANTETMQFPFAVGTRIDDGGYDAVLNMIKQTRKPFVNYVPREATGNVPIKAIIAPIFDKNEMIGLFSISINMDKEEKIESASKLLLESISEVYQNIGAITAEAEGLNNMIHSMQQNISSAVERIKEGVASIELIQGIADQSELLGINAAIVSAKAGEEGRAFAIVGTEMRKLALESAKISTQVVQSLNGIDTVVQEISKHLEKAKELSLNQYTETDNVRHSIKVITEQSDELVKYAKNV